MKFAIYTLGCKVNQYETQAMETVLQGHAVGAEVDAAVLHLQHGPGAALQPSGGRRAAKLDNLCPHFHLSMQSGCDATLKRMNRKYDTARFYQSVCLLREHFQSPTSSR